MCKAAACRLVPPLVCEKEKACLLWSQGRESPRRCGYAGPWISARWDPGFLYEGDMGEERRATELQKNTIQCSGLEFLKPWEYLEWTH
ncbi:uncharacterized protein LOC100720284 isoform X4 [Cavia porcellus]|uniref:uncharacterized protein LOC100720284 isoform X4 n=1 Tax=Cavia porcellus TaxID=10141 RepID=UPI002FE1746D